MQGVIIIIYSTIYWLPDRLYKRTVRKPLCEELLASRNLYCSRNHPSNYCAIQFCANAEEWKSINRLRRRQLRWILTIKKESLVKYMSFILQHIQTIYLALLPFETVTDDPCIVSNIAIAPFHNASTGDPPLWLWYIVLFCESPKKKWKTQCG